MDDLGPLTSITGNALFVKNNDLGIGSFGRAYEMVNRIDKASYAVKEIKVNLKVSKVSERDIAREASMLQTLFHPHIVRYFTSFLETRINDVVFSVVMELVGGGSLFDKVEDLAVTTDDIVKWWTQFASALFYMHNDMEIQHRDIKPENILLTTNSNIKIIDLGFACKIADNNTEPVATEMYFSFEKAMGFPYDGRDDVWAAGCVMAELITKQRLHSLGFIRFDKDRRERLISDCVNMFPVYGNIVGEMLEVLPDNRCTSMQLVDKLCQLCPPVSQQAHEHLKVKISGGALSRPVENISVVQLDQNDASAIVISPWDKKSIGVWS